MKIKRFFLILATFIFYAVWFTTCGCKSSVPRTTLQDSTLNCLGLKVGQSLDLGSTKITKIDGNSYEILEEKPSKIKPSKTKIKIKNVKINSGNKEVDKSKVKVKNKPKVNSDNKVKEKSFIGGPAIILGAVFFLFVLAWLFKKRNHGNY